MAEEVYDVIVVGGGVEGLGTAYYLSKKNLKLAVLEQFPLPHTRGSSHGQTRIIRKAYHKAIYTQMMKEAYTLWTGLEREVNEELFIRDEMVIISEKDTHDSKCYIDSFESNEIEYKLLSSDELSARYPTVEFPQDHFAILDMDAGILRADKCLVAFQTMIKKSGGRIFDGTKVENIEPGEIISLHTNRGVFKARRIVVAAGAWAPKMIRMLGLEVVLNPSRAHVFYWKLKDDKQRFPIFIYNAPDKEEMYGIRCLEYPGYVKACVHANPKYIIPVDPDNRDCNAEDSIHQDRVILEEFVSKHFTGLEPQAKIIETCMYTLTPDADFILDVHPSHHNIVIAAGFSGHGFKLGTIVGKVLGQMVLEEPAEYDLSTFSIHRECLACKAV